MGSNKQYMANCNFHIYEPTDKPPMGVTILVEILPQGLHTNCTRNMERRLIHYFSVLYN